jgi:hypothetical protein
MNLFNLKIKKKKDFDPVKMATNLFGTVKTSLANISFPWSANK